MVVIIYIAVIYIYEHEPRRSLTERSAPPHPASRTPYRLPNEKLDCRRQTEHYPPPLYALEWITTLFGLAARPLISLVALDLFLAGARNPVLRLCVSLLGGMEEDLLALDQEGLLKEFRSRAVAVDAEEVRIRCF